MDYQKYLSSFWKKVGTFTGASKAFKQQHRKALEDAEGAITAERDFLAARSKHLYWNNALVQNGVKAFASNVGILDVIFVDEKGTEIPFWNEAWRTFFNGIDYSGHGNFASLQTMASNCLAIEGEFFARRVSTFENEFIPFQLESLSASSIPMDYENLLDRVFNGIMIRKGKPFAYLVKPYLKDLKAVWQASQTYPYGYSIVPAEKMIHVWEKHFPDQRRGMPLLTAGMLTAWQIDDLIQSTVTQAVNSASFAFGIKKTGPMANYRQDPAMKVGKGVQDKEEETPISFYESEAGQFFHGDAEITLLQSQGIEQGIDSMLNKMQQVLSVLFYSASFQIDGDCTKYNYSSMRAALVAVEAKISIFRKTVTEPALLNRVVSWWLEYMFYTFPEQARPKVVTRYPKNAVPNLLELMRAYEIALKNNIMPIGQVYDELDINPEEFDSDRQKIWQALQKEAASLKQSVSAGA